MKVKFTAEVVLAVGPTKVFPGEVRDLPDDIAEGLIRGGYAEEVTAAPGPKPEEPEVVEPEVVEPKVKPPRGRK